jgi:serine/threonine protein kinase
MGVVYAAYDPDLDRKVALKVVHPAAVAADREGLEERFRREGRAMARLADAQVVTVHDVGVFDGRVFIAMQFVEGMTMRAWLRDAKPSVDEIIGRFVKAGRGLAAAHGVGLVHRDFKPENVLLGVDGSARVTDFGLARDSLDIDDANRATLEPTSEFTSGVSGTPAYFAPERARSRAGSAQSDQYSFCVSLFEALYGSRPRAGEAPGRHGVHSLPSRVRRVLARGLSASPADRYGSMSDLLAELTPVARR